MKGLERNFCLLKSKWNREYCREGGSKERENKNTRELRGLAPWPTSTGQEHKGLRFLIIHFLIVYYNGIHIYDGDYT